MASRTQPTELLRFALSGLAARTAKALSCEERYGSFGFCLHRNLLWQRSDQHKEGPLNYEAARVPIKVLSWSWMAYEGGIQLTPFADLPYRDLDLLYDLKFDKENKSIDASSKAEGPRQGTPGYTQEHKQPR